MKSNVLLALNLGLLDAVRWLGLTIIEHQALARGPHLQEEDLDITEKVRNTSDDALLLSMQL